MTGKLGACGGSCGPGNLHLINGLFDAHRSHAPVLAIASHIPSSEVGTGYFQETHPEILFKECSHYCEAIWNPKQFERVLHIAMQSALGKGGVGVIVLPGDVAGAELPVDGSRRSIVSQRPTIRPSEKDLAELAEMINSAKKVVLFCGFGCADAHDEVMALADKLKSPVGHSYRGKSFVQYDNPFDVGMSGLLGYGAAYRAMHECDLLLMLGTDFPYDKFLPNEAQDRPSGHPCGPSRPAEQTGPRIVGRRGRDAPRTSADGVCKIRSLVPGRDACAAERSSSGIECLRGPH